MNIGDKKMDFLVEVTKMNKSDHFDPQKSLEKDENLKKHKKCLYFTSKCSLYEGYRHILSSF